MAGGVHSLFMPLEVFPWQVSWTVGWDDNGSRVDIGDDNWERFTDGFKKKGLASERRSYVCGSGHEGVAV